MAKGEWEKLSSAVGKAARHTPPHVLVDYELPCFQLQLLDIFVYLAPGMGLEALAMQGSPISLRTTALLLPTLSSPGWILSQEKLLKEALEFLIKKLMWFLELYLLCL